MKVLVISLFSIFYFQGNAQVKLGDSVKKYKIEYRDSAIKLMVGPADTEKGYFIRVDSVLYIVTLDHHNLIHYISANDRKFITKEGLGVGNTFSQIKESDIGTGLQESMGWGKFLKLRSGWYAGFHFEYPVTENSEILFFFRK